MSPLITKEHVTWLGAGWFAGKPAHLAWTILAAAAAIGLALVIVSYSTTLVRIGPLRRAALGLIRLAIWGALLIILAAPMRIVQTFERPPGPRPLAILVDRSGSMTAADNRGHRRLDEALQKWQRLQPAAAKAFPSLKSFAFATGMTAMAAPTDAAILPDQRTDLFASLKSALAQTPPGGWSGIVALTDGIDTSGVEIAEAERQTVRAALAANTPLYFIVGHNRTIEPPFFRIRDFTVPTETLPHTIIQVQAAFESYRTDATTVPVEFTVNGQPQPPGLLQVDPGRHVETWSAQCPADQMGDLELELHAGSQLARAEVHVTSPQEGRHRILYYEGVLDWGYRFLSNILKRDDTFRVTPVFDFPNAGIALPPGAIERPPFTAEGLDPFGVVILANVVSGQIPSAAQEALTHWVEGGGVLLFLTPDNDSAQGFAGTELEKMLPVVFGPGAVAAPAETRPIQVQLGNQRNPFTVAQRLELTPFAWQGPDLVRRIFAPTPDATLDEETPRFSSYAHVERAKPGAEVLARHPADRGPDGRGAILLAVQNYGAGKSVVFTTDALWRWKLSESSQARGTELFWENFFSWLTSGHVASMRFDHPPVRAPFGQEVTLRLLGAGSAVPVQVEASQGARPMPLPELAAEEKARVFRWRPPTPGFWEVSASCGPANTARIWLTIDPSKLTGELSGAAPDEDLLRELADETGGAVLENTPPATWTYQPPAADLVQERRQPLWHRSWIFGALLGLYGLELLLRRRWNLL